MFNQIRLYLQRIRPCLIKFVSICNLLVLVKCSIKLVFICNLFVLVQSNSSLSATYRSLLNQIRLYLQRICPYSIKFVFICKKFVHVQTNPSFRTSRSLPNQQIRHLGNPIHFTQPTRSYLFLQSSSKIFGYHHYYYIPTYPTREDFLTLYKKHF